jgi:hypothetical protein
MRVTAVVEPVIAADLHDEAERLVAAIAERGVAARLTGGLAIARRCPSARRPPLAREYADVDLVCAPREGRALTETLTAAGYVADSHFNALHGANRLYFREGDGDRHIDVFVGEIRMCHVLDLRARLELLPDTLTPSDLLLSKLQVVELNAKDGLDLLALLHDQPLVAGSDEALDPDHLGALWGQDWPLWRTCQLTLRKVHELAPVTLDAPGAGRVAAGVRALDELLETCPKSGRWKLRARIGDRVRWYELPEEIDT